jgi:chitin disaccharide deacetylase
MSRDGAAPRRARRWVVCADDFALDRGAIEATLALIKLGRVTATSVLVDSPNWKPAAPELRAVSDSADVGLHLNLTESLNGGSSATWPLPLLLIQSTLRLLPRWRVRNMVERQLDAFTDAFGRLPDFIDGHQHVHQLPVVREVLIECVLAREPKSLPWLRICLPPDGDENYKARIIGMLGAASLLELARIQEFPTSSRLVGVYGFDLRRDAYLAKVRQWLDAGPEGAVFMCHPSTKASAKDPIGAARRMELGVLAGQSYADAMAHASVTAVRGTAIFKSRIEHRAA